MFNSLKFSIVIILKYLLLFFYSALVIADPGNKINYKWGRGINIPSANLRVGGYTNIIYENFDQNPDFAAIDDLSLFITWNPTAKLHFFSELEFEDAITSDKVEFSRNTFLVERLYLDFLFNESFKFRFGKFLTPVGIWNTIHAAPLVWTTSRPLVTEEFIFSPHATGLMLNGNFVLNDQNLELSVYIDDTSDLDPHKKNTTFKNALGVRINYEIVNHLNLGFSYLAFKNQAKFNSSRSHLFGFDLLWKKKNFEIQSEFIYRIAGKRQDNETGLYIQGVVPLGHHFSAVGRYEFLYGTHQFNKISEKGTLNLGVVGLAWRPFSPLVIKAEYRFGGNNSIVAPNGFITSVSTFF
jgi:hypothetical protein